MSSKSVYPRFAIVCFYILIIAFFLFLPRIKEHFEFADNTLNVYSFAGLFSFENIKKFEKKYGIKVSVKFYDSNEELFAKFKIAGGKGYDVITPSDYMVQLMSREGYLHSLDYQKLPEKNIFDNRLIGLYFDPKNQYSLPLAWTPFGLLFNKNVFKKQPKKIGLELLFENPSSFYQHGRVVFPYKVSMKDDYREASLLASLYLYGQINNITAERLKSIKKILLQQKQWVENYLHQDIGYFFIADIIHVAITDSSYAKKVMEESNVFNFIIPEEGSFISIENMAIPKSSRKIDLAHKFISFMLSDSQAIENTKVYGLNPSNKNIYHLIDKKFLNDPNFFPNKEVFDRLHIMHNELPIKMLEHIWLEVKGA